jgi:hypothetical protein
MTSQEKTIGEPPWRQVIVYVPSNLVVVPSKAWSGELFVSQPPYSIFERSDRASLVAALKARFVDPIVRIPLTRPGSWPKIDYPRLSGFRSEKAFLADCHMFWISTQGGSPHVVFCHPVEDWEWIPRPDLDGASEDRLIEAAWEFIQTLPPPKVITKQPKPRKPKTE